MSAPPNRTDLAGTPTVATYKLAIGLLYDYVAGLLGNGTATIASAAEQTKAREYLGVGTTAFKNRFINPEFLIDQRNAGASIAIPISATLKYLVDRWYALTTGAAITAQQITGISERQKSLRFTGATSNTGLVLGHRIESANCADWKNQNITVSLKSKASSAITVTWVASYATVSDTFTTVTQIATGTINVTTSVNSFSFTFNAGANVGNGLEIKFSTTALLAGATIDFDQMQIEESSVATEFQSRPVQQELALCQRYWEKGDIRIRVSNAGSVGLTAAGYFKVDKRATPTLTVGSSIVGTTPILFNFDSNTLTGLYLNITATAGGTGGCDWMASAEL